MIPRVGDPRAAGLLLLLPLVAALWWRSKTYMTGRARLALLGLRLTSMGLLVLALFDLRLRQERRGTGRAGVVVLDASDSLGPETAGAAAAELAEAFGRWRAAAGPGAKFRVAVVAKRLVEVPAAATAGDRLDPAALTAAVAAAREGAGKTATDLGAALAFGREAFPPPATAKVVLLSDGESTRGDLEQQLLATKLQGAAVYPVPLAPEVTDPLYVADLRAPRQVFVGDEYTIAGRVYSEAAGEARLVLRQNDTIVHRETLAVAPGLNPWSHKLKATATGAVGLELAVDPVDLPDLHPENNAYTAFTRVRQVPQVLLATRDPGAPLALKAALKRANLEFHVARFSDLPTTAALLARRSAVILDSPASTEISRAQQGALVDYVKKKGGGLVFIAGKDTLTRGSWFREDLARALPVDLVPRAEASPFGLYLLLDSSSSMSGPPIAQVRFAAKRIISMMAGRYLGVANFNTSVAVAVPFQAVGADGYKAATSIDQIRAVGGTAFLPGLRLAHQELVSGGTTDNHILLLSDGQPSDRFVVQRFFSTLQRDGIKVSTVGIGTQVNAAILKEIARACGGKFYGVSDLSKLVEIFEQEVERLIGPPFEEKRFVPAIRRDHFLAARLPPGPPPPLYGYLGTSLKPQAEAAVVNGYGDPVLSYWQTGLGKAVAWSSDVHGPWGRDWARWRAGFVPFWEGVIKAVVRSEVSDYKLGLHLTGKDGRVVVDAVTKEGRFLNGQRLEAVVRPPGGGAVQRAALRQTEEGRYEGRFRADQRGLYKVQLLRQAGGVDARVNEGGVALGFDPEYRPAGTGAATLRRMAAATGGRVLTDIEDIAPVFGAEGREAGRRELRFWPAFLGLGLLVYFLEITLRRLGKFRVSELSQLEGGADEGSQAYQAIANRYLRMAEDFDRQGKKDEAQRFYLKARSFFLKSNSEEKASRMWEKYRQLERV